VSSGTRGRQRGLLDQVILRELTIPGSTQEPLRPLRLGPVKTNHAEEIVKRNGSVIRYRYGSDARNQPHARQRGQGIELVETVRTVIDAGILLDIFERRKCPGFARL
jgi:hypothetical protein